MATDYLGYWMDNGAYYYYHTLPGLNYEETVLALHHNLTSRIPIHYINYDSWWYYKVTREIGLRQIFRYCLTPSN